MLTIPKSENKFNLKIIDLMVKGFTKYKMDTTTNIYPMHVY